MSACRQICCNERKQLFARQCGALLAKWSATVLELAIFVVAMEEKPGSKSVGPFWKLHPTFC